jgi:hypothetical protein
MPVFQKIEIYQEKKGQRVGVGCASLPVRGQSLSGKRGHREDRMRVFGDSKQSRQQRGD